jgi:hypothetical protein
MRNCDQVGSVTQSASARAPALVGVTHCLRLWCGVAPWMTKLNMQQRLNVRAYVQDSANT